MTTFLQYHVLTSYPASNLNRDDAGRPKTLTYGEANRLRVSSQSLKRAWRISDLFAEAMEGHIGTRSNRFAEELFGLLQERGVEEKEAIARIKTVLEAERIGKLKLPKKEVAREDLWTEQLVHLGPTERQALRDLADRLAEGPIEIDDKELLILRPDHGAVDIALFGRMLADQTRMNVEASCQVAHAFTTHRAAVEDDFYTAVDDLKKKADGDDAGAGFVGVHDYGAGVFYAYVCLNADQFIHNLGGDTALAADAAAALAETMCKVGPSGKQNSYASRARAGFCLLEVGETAPRSLAEAFLEPVRARGGDLLSQSAVALRERKAQIADVYGDAPDEETSFEVPSGEGTLADVLGLTRRAFERAS